MRKTSLFIAMSLDGYIADSTGGVGWLKGQDSVHEDMDAYAAFVKNVDTVLMGWNTYYQIVTELSPREWIYSDLTAYVFTHRAQASSEKIQFVNIDPVHLINRLKEQDGKDIWICGGAGLIQQLVHADSIDCYYITVIPTLLGSGIRLFRQTQPEIPLRLLRTQSCNGMVDLVYERR